MYVHLIQVEALLDGLVELGDLGTAAGRIHDVKIIVSSTIHLHRLSDVPYDGQDVLLDQLMLLFEFKFNDLLLVAS